MKKATIVLALITLLIGSAVMFGPTLVTGVVWFVTLLGIALGYTGAIGSIVRKFKK